MKVEVSVSTNKVGSKCTREIEFSDDELDGMDDREREDYINETALEVMHEMLDWGWAIKGEK